MTIEPLVNPAFQMQHILQNPLSFPAAVINTLSKNDFFINSMIGVLGWFNFTYQAIVYSFYFLVFGFVIRELISYRKKILPAYAILSLFLICGAAFILPFLVLYIFWTPVGYPQILGVQGRYFLILLPFIILIIHQLFITADKNKTISGLMWFFIFFVGLQTFLTVFLRYYKESTKDDALSGYIMYDPTKLKYMTIDRQANFFFETKGEKKTMTGFKFYYSTRNQAVDVPYRYKLMDEFCKKTYREGEINIAKLPGDTIYQEEFPSISLSEEKICLKFNPDTSAGGGHYLNIIAYEDSPKIELLDK